MARKSCSSHKDPAVANLKDILECFLKIEANNIDSPKFVAEGYLSLPPVGFQYIAPTLCSLRDEVAALRLEVSEVRKSNEIDARAQNSTEVLAQEVSEVKTLVQRVLQSNGNNVRQNDVDGQQETEAAAVNLNGPSNHSTDASENTVTNVTENNDAATRPDIEGHGQWQTVNKRPYSNALRRNHGPSNPGSRPNASAPRRQRREVISGRKTANSDFASSERVVDVFLGGCKASTSSEVIEAYCRENGVSLKKCESLNSRNEWTKCFKLSATLDDREKILDGDFWPCGVYVRKFFSNGRSGNTNRSSR